MPKYYAFVAADKHWKESLLVLSGSLPELEQKLEEQSLWFSNIGSLKDGNGAALDSLVQAWEEKGRPRKFGMLHPCWGAGKEELTVFNLLAKNLEEYARKLEQDGRGVFRLVRFEIFSLQLKEMVSAIRVWGRGESKIEAFYSRVEMKEEY